VLERSGATLDPRELHRLAEPLASYGAEVATFCRGPVGIAIRHRGGSEASPRNGPLIDPETGRVVAVAGRFRRTAGAAEVGSAADRRETGGCAALALERCGEPAGDFLGGLSGPFVLLVADPDRGSISIARDHLGSLKAYYFLDRHRLVAASEPAAVLRHAAVSDELDEGSAARFLGFRFGHGKRSFFRQIQELAPAHRLHVTATEARTEQYWRFRRLPSLASRSPQEISEELLGLLGRAVADDVAGLAPGQVALSLSGGLDSTALAALAPRGVRAYSWYFDDTVEGDERPQIESVSRHLDLPIHWVRGDGLHPLCGDFTDRFVHESSPYVNPFSALKCRLYQAAREAGCERVLVGDGGDALFAGREYWLRDTLAGGRPRALLSLAATIRRAARGDRFARRALRRLLPARGPGRAARPRAVPWLTAAARAALPQEAFSPILPPGRRRARHELSVGARHTELESEERRLFARCGVDRGNPFWSWPLLELAIQLPADRLCRDGRTKSLTREAFRGRLPRQVLESDRAGLLGAFFLRGIELSRAELRETVFRRPASDWRRYVRADWLETHLEATRSIAFGHTILWRVISYELWHRRLVRGA
ncbi:MAG TPA: asparagine synthase-related protein, partial [Thermoanaerobaculia bacterium]|nr:asparagine synthase-related protein [Thermoanaerobaculia bacterium]